jgi:small subunit ribosomal protein S6
MLWKHQTKGETRMAMYETIFILDSLLTQEEIDKTVDRVKEIIEANNGKLLTIDKWGKRRLAYEIEKKQYGYYVSIEFEAEGNLPQLLQTEYNFTDKVIRYLTYRYTKNKIKARQRELEMQKSTGSGLHIDEESPDQKQNEKAKKVEEAKNA